MGRQEQDNIQPEERVIWIDDEIDLDSLDVIYQIIQWNKEDALVEPRLREPIKILFFSLGGDLDVNYSIIDTITLSKTPIVGINMGVCASAAAYIYLSCHKRYMLPHAYFVFHQGSGMIAGGFSEMCARVEDYQQQVEELSDLIPKYTTFSKEVVVQNITREWYIRKDEALANGVCDKIVTDIEQLF